MSEYNDGSSPFENADVYLKYGWVDPALLILEKALTGGTSDEEMDKDLQLLYRILQIHVDEQDLKNAQSTFVKLAAVSVKSQKQSSYYIDACRLLETLGSESDPSEKDKQDVPVMKSIIIKRLINIGTQMKLPGFEGPEHKTFMKFVSMPDDLLMTFFELIVIQSHQSGIQ